MGNAMSAIYAFTTSIFPLWYAIKTARTQEYVYMLHSPSMSRLKLVPSKSSNPPQPNTNSGFFDAARRRSTEPNGGGGGGGHGRTNSMGKTNGSKHNRNTSNTNETATPQMVQCFGHDLAFSAFMQHLSAEFSMELLLSFIELTQYKKAVWDKLITTNGIPITPTTPKSDIEENENMMVDLQIPRQQQKILENTSIPLSFIVHNDLESVLKNHQENNRRQSFSYSRSTENDGDEVADDEYDKLLNEFQVRGYILYCKYVDSSSEFQINVSDQESKTLLNKLNYKNKLNQNDLFQLYDKTLSELWQLLRHSYYRFIKTPEYIDLVHYLQ